MISDTRTLARIVELFHIPIQHGADQLRDVYLQVSASCGYDNFMRTADGARLEAMPGENGFTSVVSFHKDRIRFQEENSSSSLEHFLRRLDAVCAVATEKLSIPIIIARNVTQRAIAALPQGPHSSEFMAQNLFSLRRDDLEAFGRPGQIVGFRMQFPPTEPTGGMHQVRIESYLRDPRSLFLENWGTFKVPVQSRDRSRIADELREVESFLQEKLMAFLNQFPRS